MKGWKLLSCCSAMVLACGTQTAQAEEGIYLGVSGYGSVSYKPSFSHLFYVDGGVKAYSIWSDEAYSLENKLATGYFFQFDLENNVVIQVEEVPSYVEGWVGAVSPYSITVGEMEIPLAEGCEMGVIYEQAGSVTVVEQEIAVGTTVKVYGNPATHVFQCFVGTEYVPPVVGTAGERSLKNFLATAMMPVGTSLYIYGGHWNWHDVGASNLATSIGVSRKVTDFFQSQDVHFSYINQSNYSRSYFPHQNWNQYHVAGMDCSGYVGWTAYNTLFPYSGGESLVFKSTQQAYSLANLGYGTYSTSKNLQVGDVFSMVGHTWIYLGACEDGSFVILHSTPSVSLTGAEGGGVQLTGVGSSSACQAASLANYYMETYFPQWGARYNSQYKSVASYTAIGAWPSGSFSWHTSTAGLLDLDGYKNMGAEAILEDLFTGGGFAGPATRGEAISYLWHSLACPTPQTMAPFVDVAEGDAVAVAWAYENAVTSGTSVDCFSPERMVTRGEFLCYLWNLSGRPQVWGENPFVDVNQEDYFATALLWAVEQGLTTGTSENTFSPYELVTREQIVLFLRGYLGGGGSLLW